MLCADGVFLEYIPNDKAKPDDTAALAEDLLRIVKCDGTYKPSEEEIRRREAVKAMNRIRVYMSYLMERLDTFDWENEISDLSRERKMAEDLIEKLQKTIIEGDEKMKKMSVDYLLEDAQCAYLDEIHSHYPDISEDDLFLMIMVEGSAIDIDRHMREFSKEHGISHAFTYRA